MEKVKKIFYDFENLTPQPSDFVRRNLRKILQFLTMLKAILFICNFALATASIGCVAAPCQDSDAQLHESTCLSRCDCIWDSEGVPKSKTYPSCLSAPGKITNESSKLYSTSYPFNFNFLVCKNKRCS